MVKVICISDMRGIEKRAIEEGHFLMDLGIEGDAHGDNRYCQIGLPPYDKAKTFNEKGVNVGGGASGRNLVVEGSDFRSLPVGTGLYAGSAGLVVTRIGKEHHNRYVICKRMDGCIVPKKGVSAKVVEEGITRSGDVMHTGLSTQDRPLTVTTIVLSDKGVRGERRDESGSAARKTLEQVGYEVVEAPLILDEPVLFKAQLICLSDGYQLDLIPASGGTSFFLRGQTSETTLAIAGRDVPGIAGTVRFKPPQIADHTVLSRGVSIIRGKALIVNLPGSPKAVRESLGFIMDSLEHGTKILRGSASKCAGRQPGKSRRESCSRTDRYKGMA